jgi:hypothetical protein
MSDRRPTRGPNNRVREPVRPRLVQDRDAELARLIASGNYSPATMERIAEFARAVRAAMEGTRC